MVSATQLEIMAMKIEIKILNKEFYDTGNCLLSNPPQPEYNLPKYATSGSAALDLRITEDMTLYPCETKLIPTGVAIWIGSDKESVEYREDGTFYIHGGLSAAGLILPRSGLGTKGLVLANTVGVIDEDYQGELKIAARNRNTSKQVSAGFCDGFECYEWENTNHIIKLKAGDRIAQLMFIPVIKAQWEIVEDFSSSTDRNINGFGSTGD